MKKTNKITKDTKHSSKELNTVVEIPVNAIFLAQYFDQSERTIQNWAKRWRTEGMKESKKRGTYDFVQFLEFYIKDLKKELDTRTSGDETEKTLNKQLKQIKRDSNLLDLSIKRREMMRVSDAHYILADAAATANVEFDNAVDPIVKYYRTIRSEEDFRQKVIDTLNTAKLNVASLADRAEEFADKFSKDIERKAVN